MQYPGANWKSIVVDFARDPLKVTGSNSPHMQWNDREFGETPLFKSPRASALLLDKMVAPGFGHLPAGLVMSVFPDGTRKGMMYPSDFSGIPLFAATTANATKVSVALEYAHFFAVGDKVAVGDATTKEVAMVKSIDITSTKAELTLGVALANAYAVSHKVHPAGFAVPALGVLDQAVFSDNGNGAYATIVLGNAILYKHKFLNDPEAATLKAALPTTIVDGQYVILK